MDAVWAPVFAGLGGSILGGGFALGVAAFQRSGARDAQKSSDRRAAYSQLIASSGLLLHTAGALHLAMENRSGIGEGLDVMLRIKKPLDAFELDNFLRRDTEPLYQAWSLVWIAGSAEGIRIANGLMNAATDVMGSATTRGLARVGAARLLAGEKWTEEQLATWKTHIRCLADLRRQLSEVARKELGYDDVQLWTEPLGTSE